MLEKHFFYIRNVRANQPKHPYPPISIQLIPSTSSLGAPIRLLPLTIALAVSFCAQSYSSAGMIVTKFHQLSFVNWGESGRLLVRQTDNYYTSINNWRTPNLFVDIARVGLDPWNQQPQDIDNQLDFEPSNRENDLVDNSGMAPNPNIEFTSNGMFYEFGNGQRDQSDLNRLSGSVTTRLSPTSLNVRFLGNIKSVEFSEGVLRWESGRNAGTSAQIFDCRYIDGQATLQLAKPSAFSPEAGDKFSVSYTNECQPIAYEDACQGNLSCGAPCGELIAGNADPCGCLGQPSRILPITLANLAVLTATSDDDLKVVVSDFGGPRGGDGPPGTSAVPEPSSIFGWVLLSLILLNSNTRRTSSRN